jgi:hypothetical protein
MDNQLNPLALPPDTLVKLLQKSGCRQMSGDAFQRLIDAGLPLNGDGTISIIEYTAWLLKGERGDGNQSDPASAI